VYQAVMLLAAKHEISEGSRGSLLRAFTMVTPTRGELHVPLVLEGRVSSREEIACTSKENGTDASRFSRARTGRGSRQ